MHIPDGFLSNRVALSLDALSGASILYAARRLKIEQFGHMVPVMGVLSAFVFAAQMLNFPVFGGTSGHLLGGALLGILLGPLGGLMTMATVIVAQALFLQDGGILALGANLFNMGALPVFFGYAVFRMLGSPQRPGRALALIGFFVGWASVVCSASVCALELGISGAVPLKVGLPAMAGFHAVLGVVEGALTAGVLCFLARVRPDLIRGDSGARFGLADWIGGFVLVAIPAGILVLAGASKLPDALQSLLAGFPGSSKPVESLLSAGRYTDYGVMLYCALLLLCVVAYLAARAGRNRKGES
jgi:cobalt/nickel transport system permease protein